MAKGIVVYLSYTGNTKQIAESIRQGMSLSLDKCDITPLRQTGPQMLLDYDLIGIGSPVRLGKMPAELSEFISKMESFEGKRCFVFNTHAALPVDFMRDTLNALKMKGLEVIGFKNWYCSVYLPYVPKPYFTDCHPDDIDLREARQFGQDMVERNQKILNGETNLIQQLPEGALYAEIYGARSAGALPTEVMEARAQGFKIDMHKCIRCHYCEVLCPTQSIDFSVNPPVFHKCDQCWMCEQTCPVGAISFNYPPLLKSHNIVIQKRFVPGLKIAEEKGRFRPLVRPQEVGWDLPPFVTQNPPRFKIVDDAYFQKMASEKRLADKSK
jgi:flavodoxin/ferredoxin